MSISNDSILAYTLFLSRTEALVFIGFETFGRYDTLPALHPDYYPVHLKPFLYPSKFRALSLYLLRDRITCSVTT